MKVARLPTIQVTSGKNNMIFREMYRYLIQNMVIFAALLFTGSFTTPYYIFNAFIGYLIITIFSFQHLEIFRKKRSLSVIDLIELLGHFVLGVTLLGAALYINFAFGLYCLLYLMIRYSHLLWLKMIPIVNVAMLPAEMALKGAAGAAIIAVPQGGWGLMCLFLLGLLISLGKSKNAMLFEQELPYSGPIYSSKLLNEMMAVVSSSTIVAYFLYTISPGTVSHIGTDKLVFSVPFVLYGIFRYIWLINRIDLQAEIELYLFRDKAMGINILGWLSSIVIILVYFRN